jgi:hypothetical protein
MLANALNHLSAKDPSEYVGQYRGALHQALSIDPSNKEAISQLLEYHMDVAGAGGRMASNYEQITKFATRLLEIDPNNKRAAYAIQFATLDQWLNGTQTDHLLIGIERRQQHRASGGIECGIECGIVHNDRSPARLSLTQGRAPDAATERLHESPTRRLNAAEDRSR